MIDALGGQGPEMHVSEPGVLYSTSVLQSEYKVKHFWKHLAIYDVTLDHV